MTTLERMKTIRGQAEQISFLASEQTVTASSQVQSGQSSNYIPEAEMPQFWVDSYQLHAQNMKLIETGSISEQDVHTAIAGCTKIASANDPIAKELAQIILDEIMAAIVRLMPE